MQNDNQSLVDSVQFADNPEPRCPVALLVDVSGSMGGRPIEAVNNALEQFRNELWRDTLATLRAEIAVVAFNHNVRWDDFSSVESFTPKKFRASGGHEDFAGHKHGLGPLGHPEASLSREQHIVLSSDSAASHRRSSRARHSGRDRQRSGTADDRRGEPAGGLLLVRRRRGRHRRFVGDHAAEPPAASYRWRDTDCGSVPVAFQLGGQDIHVEPRRPSALGPSRCLSGVLGSRGLRWPCRGWAEPMSRRRCRARTLPDTFWVRTR